MSSTAETLPQQETSQRSSSSSLRRGSSAVLRRVSDRLHQATAASNPSSRLSRSAAWNQMPDLEEGDSILTNILSTKRLDALRACDENVISYNPGSFGVVFRLRGRNLGMLIAPLLLFIVWDIGLALAFARNEFSELKTKIAALEGLIAPLLTPVSFLLVFRLGRAAVRFWDARAALGKLVEICRVLSSTATCGGNDDKRWKEHFARWLCCFPIATKNFLRSEKRQGWNEKSRRNKRRFEIGGLLDEEEAADIVDPPPGSMAPILVLNRLRKLAFRYSKENPMLYRQLNEQLDVLTGAWGAMERINATPLPFVYVVHLRTFLILYLLLWNLEGIALHGWYALFPLLAASWGLLGIETAAVECERPFLWHSNHLTLGKMCVVVSQNVGQTLRDAQ